jgi:aspartate carbamoyltransferase regulatory subunit
MIQNYNPRPMTAEEIKALEIPSYKHSGTNNSSGVDPNKVIQVEPIMIKQGVYFGASGVVIALLIILLLFTSCSPQKRLNRLVKKYPHLIQNDTVKVIDTIFIPSVQYDTTTIFIPYKTVEVINNEKVRLQYRYDTITREIYHEVECKGDTLIREILVPVEKYNITNDYSFVKWIVVLLIFGMGIVVFLRVWK